MRGIVNVKSRSEAHLNYAYVLPGMLMANTVALWAFDRLGMVPQWIKSAAAIFLAF